MKYRPQLTVLFVAMILIGQIIFDVGAATYLSHLNHGPLLLRSPGGQVFRVVYWR